MKITIEIPDDEIRDDVKRMVETALAEKVMKDNYGDARWMKKEYVEAMKKMIYDPEVKKEVIDRTVAYAADEIRRKAMPILSKKLFGEME